MTQDLEERTRAMKMKMDQYRSGSGSGSGGGSHMSDTEAMYTSRRRDRDRDRDRDRGGLRDPYYDIPGRSRQDLERGHRSRRRRGQDQLEPLLYISILQLFARFKPCLLY